MGRKSKADSRRPEILQAAYETLKEESLESASLAKIARRAGIAPSLITHYFNSKEELIFALTDYLMEKYDEFLMKDFTQISSSKERLKAIISTRLNEFKGSVVEDRIWYNIFSLGLRNESIRVKIKEVYSRDQDELVKQLHSCATEPIPPNELIILARNITISMEGLGYYAAIHGESFNLSLEVDRLEAMYLNEATRVLGLRE